MFTLMYHTIFFYPWVKQAKVYWKISEKSFFYWCGYYNDTEGQLTCLCFSPSNLLLSQNNPLNGGNTNLGRFYLRPSIITILQWLLKVRLLKVRVLKVIVLKMRVLNESGIEYDIVEVILLCFVAEMEVCSIEVVFSSLLLNMRVFNVMGVEQDTRHKKYWIWVVLKWSSGHTHIFAILIVLLHVYLDCFDDLDGLDICTFKGPYLPFSITKHCYIEI